MFEVKSVVFYVVSFLLLSAEFCNLIQDQFSAMNKWLLEVSVYGKQRKTYTTIPSQNQSIFAMFYSVSNIESSNGVCTEVIQNAQVRMLAITH